MIRQLHIAGINAHVKGTCTNDCATTDKQVHIQFSEKWSRRQLGYIRYKTF